MKIRITRGIYGYREDGNVIEKTRGDLPFEVNDEEGERLISLNVAESVDITGKAEDSMTESMMPETENGSDVSDPFSIEELEHMSKEELCRLAERYEIKKNGSKTELAERIYQFIHVHGEAVPQDEDEVPELTAEDPE